MLVLPYRLYFSTNLDETGMKVLQFHIFFLSSASFDRIQKGVNLAAASFPDDFDNIS